MKTSIGLRKLMVAVIVIIIGAQSSCAPAPQALPTQTAIVNTSTPLATATSTHTPTPEATATPTETPLPTATFTPAGTPTQLPEIPPPQEWKGNVIGLALWNDQPLIKAWIRLCEGFNGFGCTGNNYSTYADQNGYFVFRDVIPGRYLVAIDAFGTGWWEFYFDSQNSKTQNVSAGKNLILDPWNIYKVDLGVISPKIEKNLSEATPTFKWKAYPDAAYYQISIYNEKNKWILQDKKIDVNEFIPDAPMIACKYYWYVEVFNAQGVKISQTKPPGTGDLVWFFTLINLPESC